LDCRKGSVAFEFALVAPVMFYLVLATLNLGFYILDQIKLATAVNAGAQYSLAYYTNNVGNWNASGQSGKYTSAFTPTIQSVIRTIAGLTLTSNNVVYNNNDLTNTSCYCPTGTGPNWSWGSAVACGASSASATTTLCASGDLPGKYVSIKVTYAFTPIIPNPWIGATTLTEFAMVRLQ
jgi:Flp pilus assembly protein TadG